MQILIDTNLLISAVLNPNGTPARAVQKAVDFQVIECQQNIDELNNFFLNKFPAKLDDLMTFNKNFLPRIKIIPIPPKIFLLEERIRDVKDKPILRAAVYANVDIIITGDKDFLEAGIDKPKILTARDFLDEFVS